MDSDRGDNESWSITLDRERRGQVIAVQLLHRSFFRRREVLGTGKLSVSRGQRPVDVSTLLMSYCS